MLTPNIDLQNKSILITGAAGFIGANLVMELLRDTDAVKIVGLDSMSDYYDVSIKEYRLAEIDKIAKQKNDSQWIFVKGSIADRSLLERLFQEHCFDTAVRLILLDFANYLIYYTRKKVTYELLTHEYNYWRRADESVLLP